MHQNVCLVVAPWCWAAEESEMEAWLAGQQPIYQESKLIYVQPQK